MGVTGDARRSIYPLCQWKAPGRHQDARGSTVQQSPGTLSNERSILGWTGPSLARVLAQPFQKPLLLSLDVLLASVIVQVVHRVEVAVAISAHPRIAASGRTYPWLPSVTLLSCFGPEQ